MYQLFCTAGRASIRGRSSGGGFDYGKQLKDSIPNLGNLLKSPGGVAFLELCGVNVVSEYGC